ncbi:nonstructural protein [Sigmofec virus UA08Rod_5712]|uniref:Nonstructural protein n=1 Tax=Sigmofec virus UA08Rod_5712 TaxID=2929438 RepID=A0A976N0W5_9VIRU|nr:nonstructural protein [Sigmofec virus UA08Rod_5712]
MVLKIYAIRDLRTCFMTPTVDLNDSSAMRNFEAACRRSDSLMYSHSEDYSLFAVGYYDQDTGKIEPVFPPELVIDGKSIVAEKE